ncbi:PAAR-like domain-containing protein [Vibrio bivalvicida]|uniref:PAAR-like domain-containing protein n=1 Tax=Vibrio bivalvicida TaxID=1276888 RepID=A0ABV4MPX3_9VIBR
MGVTVCANGLSVVHKGSGGEANATLPDVCLTTVGNSVVPIPYGNNAKSADLADGTTTVSMDGGNSIAIKGSKFSASTGDAGGDKKGVSSGTIEAEAEFISASPTVKFEGKGVCRLSDQMTMNKANTMCLGGAQNPSVSVTEDQEGTYTVSLHVTYDDGEGFQAPYKLIDQKGKKSEGELNEHGKAEVSNVAPGEFTIEFGEDKRDFKPDARYDNTNKNPYYKKKFDPNEIIEQTKIGQVAFWEAQRNQNQTVHGWIWGVIIGDFNENATSGQIFLNTVLGVIPGIDQVMDARDITANIFFLCDEEKRNTPDAWVDLVISAIGAIPMIGSVMKGVGKAIQHKKSRDELFSVFRGFGKGDVDKFIKNIDWDSIKYEILEIIFQSINSFNSVLDELAKYANWFDYPVYAEEIAGFQATLNTVKKEAESNVPDALMHFKDLLDQSMKRGKQRSTNGSHQQQGTAQASSHDETVSQDKKNKKPDECWLCEKKVGKKKPKTSSATYCEENGFKGKHYSKKDKAYGFTGRGNKSNGHYPWVMLKAHNNRANASSMQHPLYARCYDKNPDGRSYVRPQQLWSKKEAEVAFEELKSLGGTEREKIEGLERNLQAHHIITVNEMENNKFLFKKLPFLGYDLNDWHNIVVLPGIPELACFYEMPLHSGPHPSPYTRNVKRQLQDLAQDIKDSLFCDDKGFNASQEIVKTMKAISSEIYKQIVNFNRDGALNDKNYDVYKSGNKGCCNKIKHSDIDSDSSPCRHRRLSTKNILEHHDFRTTKGGIPARIPYLGARISKLGY